ncbi:MAG: replicative DNA helicase [Clostridia bacterium]|nr:replicative DNA helicase [Clostridia bacterium]
MEQALPGGRVPPHHLEAERSVLGAMLQSAETVMLAQESLKPDDFYDPAHREIFDAMMNLSSHARPVDLVTLDEELTRRGSLEGVGGLDYLISLSQFVPTTANAGAYIRIIDEKSTLRRLISASQDITQASYAAEEETADILAEAEKKIYDITMRKGGEMLQSVQTVLMDTYERIETLAKNRGQIEGVPTGYPDLDRVLTGMHPGEFILIAARPSMGKTSIGLNIVANAAIRHGAKCAVFSLEMPAEQLVMRLLCSEAKVDMQAVRRGTLTMEDWERLTDAMVPIARSQIYIDATSAISVPEVRSKARRLQMEHGLDLILIDYLSLMSATGRNNSRQEEVSSISRALKGLAQELKVPVMVLQQLSRANTGRSDHRPILSDIRDSGAIEQDADVVMFLHREAYYDPETDKKNIAELIIAKQRNGPLGTVELGWQAEYTKFVDLVGGQQPPM